MSTMGELLGCAATSVVNHILDGALKDAITSIAKEVDRAYRAKYIAGFMKELDILYIEELLDEYGVERKAGDYNYGGSELNKLFEETKDEMLQVAEKLDFHSWAIEELVDVIKGDVPKEGILDITIALSETLQDAYQDAFAQLEAW